MKRLAAGFARGILWLLAIVAVLTVLIAGAAWAWLPRLGDYRPQVERHLSDLVGQEIAMTALDAEWDGLRLVFKASGVRVAVEDHPGSGMRFGEIFLSFNPFSLLEERGTFDHLEVRGATIEVSRLPDGRFRVGDTIIGQPRGLVRRLLQGRNLEVVDSTIVWRDALSPADELEVDDVRLRIRSDGEQRRLQLDATPPPELMQSFSARARYDPRTLRVGEWNTALDLSVSHLNLTAIPKVIQERLPWQTHGYIDTDFHVAWRDGVLVEAAADVTAHDFIIPYARDRRPLSARRFTSDVSWQRAEDDWRLVFTEPEILLDEAPVSVSRFEVRRRDDQRTYVGRDVNVQDLLGVVNRLDIELPWKELIDRLQPRGLFAEAALTLTGPYLAARDWRFEGDFRNVGWRAQQHYPGIQGLDGRMVADDKGGELSIATTTLEVDAANSLPAPVMFKQVTGGVEWYRWGGDWVVDVSDGVAANDDITLTDINFYSRVPAAPENSPFVLARCRIERADVAALRRYLPAKRMSTEQVAWLDRALGGGEILRGRFYMNGPLDAFPYRQGEGELQVSARFRSGVLDFHEKWPALEDLEGVVEVANSRFEARIDGGAMMSSRISEARIWSDDFFRRDRLLHIDGEMKAQADDVVQFLSRGPLNDNPPPEHSRMNAQGQGDLSLAIELPFTRLKEATRVTGRYAFQDAAIELNEGVEVQDLSGAVAFTESTVQGSGLEGRLFGGPLRADITTVEPGRPMTFALSGSGQAQVSLLAPVVGAGLVSRLGGRARWEGRLVVGPGPNRLTVRSDLKGVEVLLPKPLWKLPDTEAALAVDMALDRDEHRIDFDLADRIRGTLHYARTRGRPELTRGVLNLGADRALPDRELIIAVKGEHIDADQWIAEINDLKDQPDEAADSGRDRLFDHLRALYVDVNRFRYLHRDLGALEVGAETSGDKRWTARLNGERVEGSGQLWLDRTPAHYRFDLSRLYWPRVPNVERVTSYEPPPHPSRFAYLTISAEDFRYGDMRLGRLELRGAPTAHEWRIRELSLRQPEFEVDVTGDWSVDQFGAHRTRVEVAADSSHLGRTLAHLGLEEQVAKGKADLNAVLSWPGEPGDFSLAKLDGELSLNAKDGRFLKLEPGSGRLLGLFNAEALTRRFTLDFTDVFEEGLAFDRIDGDADITSGQLQTDGIFIFGPAALLDLSGSTNLGQETYDLEVTVAPQLGGNLSLAGAIANPAAGAMIFVVQKLFKKQMAKLIHYKYRVTGEWDDPQVEPVVQSPGTVDQLEQNRR